MQGETSDGALDVEDDRYRPVVHELHLHPGAEDAGLDLHAEVAEPLTEPLVERLRLFGRRGVREVGLFPFAVSAISVNWLTTSAAPPLSSSERSNLPSSFSKIRSFATLSARRAASASPSSRETPRSTQRPGADLPHHLAAHAHARLRDALDDRSHGAIIRGL